MERGLWDHIFAQAPWEKKGEKCVLNRFMGVRRRALTETAVWQQRSFSYQFMCLEQGFFRGAKFQRLCVRDEAAGAPGGTTSTKKAAEHEQTLRRACANYAVIAALVYANTDNCVRMRILAVATDPLERWHHLQSTMTRSVWDTRRRVEHASLGCSGVPRTCTWDC